MSTKTTFYGIMYGRTNDIQNAILGVAYAFSSYPRLVMEVFTRKDFGERYFSLASALTVAAVMLYFPAMRLMLGRGGDEVWSILKEYLTWLIFLGFFVVQSFKHYRAVKNAPNAFDSQRSTVYSGTIHPFFTTLKIGKDLPTYRFIECVLEPAAFFVPGLFLFLIGQKLGILLIVCAIIYSLAYCASYKIGDNILMNMADQSKYNKFIKDVIANGSAVCDKSEIDFRVPIPDDVDLRKELLSDLYDNDKFTEAK